MLKVILIFLTTLGVGVGVVAFLDLSAPNNGSYSPALQSVQQVSNQSASRTIQNTGPRQSTYFEEACEGRCRCPIITVNEDVAKPGIVTASREFARYPNQNVVCPGSGGSPQGFKVPGQPGQCYICPTGMTLSTLLRDGKAAERRWGYYPVCVFARRACKNN